MTYLEGLELRPAHLFRFGRPFRPVHLSHFLLAHLVDPKRHLGRLFRPSRLDRLFQPILFAIS